MPLPLAVIASSSLASDLTPPETEAARNSRAIVAEALVAGWCWQYGQWQARAQPSWGATSRDQAIRSRKLFVARGVSFPDELLSEFERSKAKERLSNFPTMRFPATVWDPDSDR